MYNRLAIWGTTVGVASMIASCENQENQVSKPLEWGSSNSPSLSITQAKEIYEVQQNFMENQTNQKKSSLKEQPHRIKRHDQVVKSIMQERFQNQRD